MGLFETLIVIGIVLLLVCTIVLIALILGKNSALSQIKKEISVLEKQMEITSGTTNEEIRRLSDKQNSSQQQLKDSLSEKISGMNDKVQSLTQSNLEQQIKMRQTLSDSIFKLQESNEKRLEKMRETVDEKLTSTLTTRLDSSFKTVSEQLKNVYESLTEMKQLSTGVTDNVTALTRVLTNVKARGTWAEVQLGGILDQTIPNMYETNVETKKGSGKRVEFAVKIPSVQDDSIVYLPIDSKFPLEDYVRLMDAADRADREELDKSRKALEKRIIEEAKEITKYIDVPATTPFAIMYLATEGLYAEVAASRTGLPERLQNEYNIMIAGPSTVTALLNSLSVGFKTVAINKKVGEIGKVLSASKKQYENFALLLDKAYKKVDEAGKTIDDAKKRNSIIRKKLKSFEDFDDASSSKILGLDDIDSE